MVTLQTTYSDMGAQVPENLSFQGAEVTPE